MGHPHCKNPKKSPPPIISLYIKCGFYVSDLVGSIETDGYQSLV